MRQQQSQPLTHPSRHTPILAAPKQAVVHKNSVCLFCDGGFNERLAGGHARDDFFNFCPPFNLQPIGAVVLETVRL